MFTGGINSKVRKAVYNLAIPNKKTAVLCSGNFNIERILNEKGITDIISSDVSLYSNCLGAYLTGKKEQVIVTEDEFKWLEKYDYTDPLVTACILTMLMEMLKFEKQHNKYYQKMWNTWKNNFDSKLDETVARYKELLKDTKITEYRKQDMAELIDELPEGMLVITSMPTYAKGYERPYKRINEIFTWIAPQYTVIDDDGYDRLVKKITDKFDYIILTDKELEVERLIISVESSGLKPFYAYSNLDIGKRYLSMNRNVKKTTYERLTTEKITKKTKIQFIKTEKSVFDYYRLLYLQKGIMLASTNFCLYYLIFADSKLFGFVVVSKSKYGDKDGVYVMSDFCVSGTVHKRLSKLVTLMITTKQFQKIVSDALIMNVNTADTTAFTDKGSSMKYRGAWNKIKEGSGDRGKFVQYRTEFDKTIKQVLDLWITKYQN